MKEPRVPHLHVVHHLLQYLKYAPGQGLFFPAQSSLKLIAFADADWASCVDTRRSTSGFCVFLGNNLLSWHSKKQSIVSKLSTEAEYCALSFVTSEVVWLKMLLLHFEIDVSSVILFCDNKFVVSLASNPTHHEWSKHIDIDHHFIREFVQSNVIKLVHVKSQHQVTDVFTKALSRQVFGKFITKLGMINIYSPT